MEKVSYGFVLGKYYPKCKWSIQEGRKGYEYDAYIWDKINKIPMPSKEELDQLWQEAKKETWVWQEFIKQRNERLRESDIYALVDYPHASEKDRQAWYNYRQALRDLTKTAVPICTEESTVGGVEWPAKPI